MSTPAQLSFLKQKTRNQMRLGEKTMPLNSIDFDYWLKHDPKYLSEITENSFVYETVTVNRIPVKEKESK